MGAPSDFAVLFVSAMRFVPARLRSWVYSTLGGHRIEFMEQTGLLAKRVAQELVDEKAAALAQGEGGKDILSLCVKANAEQNSRGKLTNEEMLSQLQ